MELDGLFVDTLEDLRRRCDLRATEYEMVQAAGLLRRLLLDEQSLWEVVNRRHRVKIECKWTTVGVYTASGALVPMLWVDPELVGLQVEGGIDRLPQHSLPRGGIGSLLKAKAVTRGAAGVTYQELIKHYANREGGVHFDPSPAQNQLLADVRQESEDALRLTVVAVGRIVHRALEPLAARVLLADRPQPYGFAEVKMGPPERP